MEYPIGFEHIGRNVFTGREMWAVTCPICKENYVHPTSLVCVGAGNNHTKVTVDSAGVAIDTRSQAEGRGVKIIMAFVCECGHSFNHSFHFHKGVTCVESESFPEEIPMEEQPDVIWRD